MRVQSGREKQFSDGSVGWLHRIDGGELPTQQPRKPEVEKERPNMAKIMERWARFTTTADKDRLARDIGVSLLSIELLAVAKRDDHTWAFPMRDPSNHICGIRLRSDSGHKWAVTGSHQGLFLPQYTYDNHTVFLPEGPTNTAAVLSLGKHAIGRPSSNGAVLSVAEAVKRSGCRRAVIVADTDSDFVRPKAGTHFNPGADGAELLASKLTIKNCTLLLPCKDMRDFVRNGGDAATLDYLVDQCIWRHPKTNP